MEPFSLGERSGVSERLAPIAEGHASGLRWKNARTGDGLIVWMMSLDAEKSICVDGLRVQVS